MKQWLPTILLVLVCAGGIWYAAANDFFVKSEEEAKGVNELVSLTNENIEKIRITTDTNDVELVFNDGAWEIAGKAGLRINTSNVDGWINSLMLMVYSDVIDENPSDLAQFGLKEPTQRYEVSRKGKKKIVVEAGIELPTMGSKYVKVNDSKAVYKVSMADLDALNKGELDFIQKNPIVVNYDTTQRIKASWQDHAFDIKKSADKKSADEVKSVLTDLTSWTTTKDTKSLDSIDTSVPDFRLSIFEQIDGKLAEKQYIGMIGADEVWIAELGGKWAYSIDMATVEAFMTKMDKNEK